MMSPAEKMQFATAAMGGDEGAAERLRAAGILRGDHLLLECVRIQREALDEMSPAERAADFEAANPIHLHCIPQAWPDIAAAALGPLLFAGNRPEDRAGANLPPAVTQPFQPANVLADDLLSAEERATLTEWLGCPYSDLTGERVVVELGGEETEGMLVGWAWEGQEFRAVVQIGDEPICRLLHYSRILMHRGRGGLPMVYGTDRGCWRPTAGHYRDVMRRANAIIEKGKED